MNYGGTWDWTGEFGDGIVSHMDPGEWDDVNPLIDGRLEDQRLGKKWALRWRDGQMANCMRR